MFDDLRSTETGGEPFELKGKTDRVEGFYLQDDEHGYILEWTELDAPGFKIPRYRTDWPHNYDYEIKPISAVDDLADSLADLDTSPQIKFELQDPISDGILKVFKDGEEIFVGTMADFIKSDRIYQCYDTTKKYRFGERMCNDT